MVRVKGNYVQRWVHRPDLLSLQRNKWNPITRHLWMKKKYTDRPTTYWTTVIVRQMTREYIQMALTPRPMTIEEHDCQTNTDNLKPYVGWRDQGSWWRWILRNNGCYVLRKIHAPPDPGNIWQARHKIHIGSCLVLELFHSYFREPCNFTALFDDYSVTSAVLLKIG